MRCRYYDQLCNGKVLVNCVMGVSKLETRSSHISQLGVHKRDSDTTPTISLKFKRCRFFHVSSRGKRLASRGGNFLLSFAF